MNDLLNPLFSAPILIVLAEILAMIYPSRRRIKRRFTWVIGSYLVFVAACLVLGLVASDEFGFSFIPLLVMVNPWGMILEKLFRSLRTDIAWLQSLPGMTFGVLVNCAIFSILGKVSYPKHSAKLSGQHVT